MGPIFGSPVDPHDDPERQQLEQKLWDDERLESQTHQTLESERRMRDVARQTGHPTPHAEERIQFLEENEQRDAAHVVADQQAIEHWDHDHPWSPVTRGVEQELTEVYHAAGTVIHDVTGASLPEFSAERVADQAWEASTTGEETGESG
jgi:hypothetical protein